MNPSEFVKTFLLNYIALKHEDHLNETKKDLEDSKDEMKITPSCSQQSNQDLFIETNEPTISNSSDHDSITLDCDEDSNDSSESVDLGMILKSKLKQFCLQAIMFHKSTWKDAIEFAKHLENHYENNLT